MLRTTSSKRKKLFSERFCSLGRNILQLVVFRSRFQGKIAPTKKLPHQRTIQLDVVDCTNGNNVIIFYKPTTALVHNFVGVILEQDFGSINNGLFVPNGDRQHNHVGDASGKNSEDARNYDSIEPIKNAVAFRNFYVAVLSTHFDITTSSLLKSIGNLKHLWTQHFKFENQHLSCGEALQ